MGFFGYSLSLRMTAPDVLEFNRTISSQRLTVAQGAGIRLDELYFRDDGHLAWDGMGNHMSGYDLHTEVQSNLLRAEVQGLVDPAIRQRLRDSSNAKLQEAFQLGIAIHDIRIGFGAIPEWDQEAVDSAVPLAPQPVKDHWEDSAERNNLTFGANFMSANSEEMDMTLEDNTTTLSQGTSSDDESSTSGESSSHVTKQQHGELDDDRYIYAMHANGDLQPLPASAMFHWRGGDDAPHIIRDVEIHGGPDGTYLVDMEVYEADNDSDFDELPEAELAIDATAYEFFFPTDEAVDANLPGKMLECTIKNEDVMKGL
ncbi:hypothetical protein ACQKWADRAFT_327248 [Trichoderma austrokoningii]